MKTVRGLTVFFFLFSIVTSICFAEKAVVRYVIDGDTFILKNNQRVRMIGINAPEISHAPYEKRGQAFGSESKNFLKETIENKEIELKNGPEEYDRFGRRLAYVYLSDGTFVNQKMVELGYAETFRKFSFDYKRQFLDLEEQARSQKLGMWGHESSSTTKSFSDWFKNLFSGG